MTGFLSFTNIISMMFILIAFGYAVRKYSTNKQVSFVGFSTGFAFIYMWMQIAHYADWYDKMLWEKFGERPEPLITWGNMSDQTLQFPLFVALLFLLSALFVRIREVSRKNRSIRLAKKHRASSDYDQTEWSDIVDSMSVR